LLFYFTGSNYEQVCGTALCVATFWGIQTFRVFIPFWGFGAKFWGTRLIPSIGRNHLQGADLDCLCLLKYGVGQKTFDTVSQKGAKYITR